MALAAIGLPCRLLAANLRSATPPVARTRSTPARQPPQRSLLLPGLASRRDQIPIAPAALAARSPHHRIDPTRGSLPWRFSYAGPRCMWHRRHGAGIRKPSQLRTLVDAAGGSGMCQLRTHAPQQAASVACFLMIGSSPTALFRRGRRRARCGRRARRRLSEPTPNAL